MILVRIAQLCCRCTLGCVCVVLLHLAFVQWCNVTWEVWQSQSMDGTFSIAQALEKRSLYTCQDGTRIYTVFTHLDYTHLKLELF